MNKFRRTVMWVGLALIILLLFVSVYGAFIGAERAQSFINRLPLMVYWIAFLLLLIVALSVFRRLVRVPGLLLIHLGCVFILAGSMWASEAGHKLQKKLFGIDKITKGQMEIHEGHSDNRVLDDNMQIKELPFSVELKDFQIEYYKPAYLYIQTRDGQGWKIPVEIGSEFPLGPEFGTVKILRTFENFKVTIEDGNRKIIDDPQPGLNPALEVQITSPQGQVTTKYVFERFGGHTRPEDKLALSYRRVISDYISQLRIIKDERIVAEKDIEVNHPLSFGGYRFYQHSYDAEAGQYTVLMVVSDTGVGVVFAGCWMLCIGVFWHMWLRHIVGFDVGSSFVHITARIKTKNK
ncbi:MAG: cytochrome c biogenesis protein ResB [Planctomycetes bacterium]|nr:cytochrome c biogenesis protein ResB [Planctomycetota bacterium]